jgi:hypothetical protein
MPAHPYMGTMMHAQALTTNKTIESIILAAFLALALVFGPRVAAGQTLPPDVSDLKAVVADGLIVATWTNPETGFKGVLVYVSEDKGETYLDPVDVGQEDHFSFPAVLPIPVYRILVRTYDADGNLSEGRVTDVPITDNGGGGGGVSGGGCFLGSL